MPFALKNQTTLKIANVGLSTEELASFTMHNNYYTVAAVLEGEDIPKPPPPSSEATKKGTTVAVYTPATQSC